MSEPLCSVADLLAALNGRENLFAFLRSKLSWSVDPEDTFLYSDNEAVGRAAARADLSQIVPFSAGDPFVIFLVEFTERFRRGDLREILRGIRRRIKEEAAYKSADLDELIFVCTLPEGLRFVHFEEHANRQPKLRVFGYDRDSVAETFTLRTVNLPLLRLTTNLLGEVDWKACRKSWQDAWSVEKVTKQFFRDYRDVFTEVETHHIHNAPGDKRLFVQRFFNRLMFLHFLSKKGWLRAPGKSQEDGGREYLSDLWKVYQARDKRPGDSFYLSHLAPLFFAALNQPYVGRNNPVLPSVVGDVPYLNGGLFEQTDDDRAAFTIEDAAFTKIMERLFSCYNFTVAESTPDDADVAVDPEMLGKVFEELVTGRHESGSYYTPRPVVQFMCREALKGYLTPCGAGIETLVDLHDASEITNHEVVLSALRSVSVVDPACGSGAYLLGMLQELMALRLALFNAKRLDDASAYNRKLEIIQNSIYGVDLDQFAVNTARLRLWLSLVVEDGRNPLTDTGASVALPNLDFKIECGDSVSCPDPQNLPVQVDARAEMIRQFEEKKHTYGDVNFAGNRPDLLAEIEALRKEIAAETPGGEGAFDWRVDFGEVFSKAQKGFDIVLANPPYVRGELIKDLKPTLKRVYGDRFGGTMDLYCFFYFRAIELLKDGGQLVFITPNKWFRAGYGVKLRETIAATCKVRSITDFGELPVFETAATFPMIFVAQKGDSYEGATTFTQVKSLNAPYPNVKAVITSAGFTLPATAIHGKDWSLSESHVSDRLKIMERAGIPLGEYVKGKIYRGILTGFNAAFVIDGKKRDELIAADSKSAELIKPLAVGDDIRRWRIEKKDKWLIVTKIGVDISRYPAVFKHLSQWESELKIRRDQGNYWWELRACAYYNTFDHPKIMYPVIGKEPRFTIDNISSYTNDKTFLIGSDSLFLLGVLNSSTVWGYLKSICSVLGDEEKGGRLELRSIYVSKIPIPNATDDEKAAISALVQACLDKRGQGVEAEEAEINARVAALYGL
ncbi:Eco57I restriction-modification methylase domain-containing protein [Armatimonas sp.]|uniref:Eco57I restriction-modification methylase domain-containing protein n=1 Tax=Armatimonas sp. TaxID=1872638 RepID=UPI003752DF24